MTAKTVNPRKELCGMMDRANLAGDVEPKPSTNLPVLLARGGAMVRVPLYPMISRAFAAMGLNVTITDFATVPRDTPHINFNISQQSSTQSFITMLTYHASKSPPWTIGSKPINL